MYQPVSDELLKTGTNFRKLDYLYIIQNYLQNNAIYLDLQEFEFDPEHCSIIYSNKWGNYSNKPPIYTEEKIVAALQERISTWSNTIATNAFKHISRSDYKTIMTHIQRYLTHLIPSQDALEKILNQAEEVEDKIEDVYVLEDYSSIKASQILKEGYVYAIAVDNIIVYIGYTARPLLNRLKEHWTLIQNPEKTTDTKYQTLAAAREQITFKLLYQVTTGITEFELQNIERALIEAYQPCYNVEGVTIPYGAHNTEYQYAKARMPFFEDKLDNIAKALDAMTKEFKLFQEQMI